MPVRVITFGTFDLFHIGHLEILRRAKDIAPDVHLTVGISSDALNIAKKGTCPTIPLAHRLAIVQSIRYVDEVFVEHSLAAKQAYCQEHHADVLIMGDDHTGRFDDLRKYGVDVRYLPRTPNISTTYIRSKVQRV
jgi:glycerol-3-phosphate cytidylyltransferase